MGCHSTQIIDNKFLNPQSFYKITLPDESWERVKVNNEDLAMRNKHNNATFAIISHNTNTNKATLDALYKQLFIGIKRKSILEKQYVYVDHRRALNIVLEGVLDDFKVKISAYIINSSDFIYDIIYWSTPDKFDTSIDDFERVVKSFKFITHQTEQL